jgi:ketosteroid isomerase-like protein
MKIRLLLTLAGFAISFVVPAVAQEQKTVDPEVRQQIEAVLAQYDEAFNKQDAAAVAALFTPVAVEVWGWSSSESALASGQQAIEKRYADQIAGMKCASKLVQVYPIGSEVCAITKESVGMWKNTAVRIYVRDADTWKINMAYVISTMAPE